MDQQDQRNAVKKVLRVLSNITVAVKVTPFIYSAIFVVVYFIYSFAGDNVLDVLDVLFYMSPIAIIIMLIYSRILEFCIWHRIACVIPMIPQIIDLIDSHYEFTQIEVLSINLLCVMLTILLIFSAYKVFFKDERRKARD